MKEYKRVWIRIAGHVIRIKTGQKYPWRLFVDYRKTEIPFETWKVRGEITEKNFFPGTNQHSEALGLYAWIDIFCNLTIDESETAHINVLNPTEEESAKRKIG